MGVFWPLDNPSHGIRLAALVGVAVGCCALADRDTRLAILRYLYNQIKSLDEASALEIESAQKEDKRQLPPPQYLPRDARSFASESTAFSRAASPVLSVSANEQHNQEETQREPEQPSDSVYEESSVSQPSSALCNTPEAVTQLGEALKRWKNTQSATPNIPSPLSRAPTTPPSRDLNFNLPVQESAVAVAADEILLPLTTAAGPQTPQSEATPTPIPEEPKAKVIDASKRLTPIPNPSAPKIKPSARDGRPQPFDYLPPTPSNEPVKPAAAARRERSHVQIEMTEHDSYGFVSNPSALVLPPAANPPSATSKDATAAAGAASGDHYLFVCIKCHRQNTNEVCEKICSDEDGVLRCKLRPRNGQLVDDMEDLVLPVTPNMYMDGRRKTTGRMLYENLQALHTQHERMKARTACHGTEPHSHGPGSRDCPNAVKSRLRIVPVNCLSMCHLGNVIAVAAPGKFSYQFGAMHESDSEDLQAILQFAEDYIEIPDGFTKNKTRPARLSRNILSRIPPPLPTFTSIAE
ncbi:hypothetical protein LPJ53_004174 [Coemansia erecta]|uniref:Uncharacterized protein n=1 Tax=Coemansia erecta TaxID=147472 RepID=A0A9W7XZ31_9FUNG|nr:hypothetical protein LPJ53_004174 [Coemansia erecta]